MKKTYITTLLLALCLSLHAQNVGEWKNLLSYRESTQSLAVGETIYALFSGNLLSYNTSDESVRIYSKIDGLHGKEISLMGYSKSQDCLVLVYDDSNIDLVYPSEDGIINIPDMKNNAATIGKLNNLSVAEDYACLSTEKGVVVLNLKDAEVRGYYPQSGDVYDAAVFDGQVFTAQSSGIYYGSLKDNLSDGEKWQKYGSQNVNGIVNFADGLYFSSSDEGLFRLDPADASGVRTKTQISTLSLKKGAASNNRLVFFNAQRVVTISQAQPKTTENDIAYDNQWTSVAINGKGELMVSETGQLLRRFSIADGQLQQKGEEIGGYGPLRDLCYHMKMQGNRLFVSGGRIDYTKNVWQPGTAMMYEDGKWQFFSEDRISQITNYEFYNTMSIAQDPKDENHHFIAAGGGGLYEFRDFKFEKLYNFYNSPLQSQPKDIISIVRVTGAEYDNAGNLWIMNQRTDTVIRILRPDGKWSSVYVEDMKNNATAERCFFDSKGRFWMNSRAWYGDIRGGILCLDYNGTIDDTKDDVATYRYTAPNEDGAVIDLSTGVYDITQDHDGAIWVGAETGVYVIDNPDDFTRSDFYFNQIKVPRNDGTNYADYLLAGTPVTAIAVDGANRKWLGTASSGLYLVSPDGREILKHFTTSNSALPDDGIYTLAVHPKTGEVYIGTGKGLTAYQSEVSEPAESLSKDNIRVYPNPVRPGFKGNVTITGLTQDADIRIMTPSGYAVASGTSTGGTFIWDVRTFEGTPVSTGVYYIMIADKEGGEHLVSKITIIR